MIKQFPIFNLLCKSSCPTKHVTRFKSSFMLTNSAETLWKSTSPMAKRSGRGKRAVVKKRIDLGRRIMVGEGQAGILWPGLNINAEDNMKKRSEEEQNEFLAQKEEKNKMLTGKKMLTGDRGWTGGQWGGLKLGPPEPAQGHSYDEFSCVLLNVARVSHMNMEQGRVYSMRANVAIGNGNGMIGVTGCSSPSIVGAVRKARIKAVNRLQYFERWEERTVFEDVYVNHHKTWMYIRKQPPGYGLRCHRAIRDMCKLIGIKDIYVKVEGSTTMLNLVKCFLKGLRLQETYQQKADRVGYHVVEFDEQRHNFPVVLASPSSGEVKSEPYNDYEDYMNQELVLRDQRKRDPANWSSFYKAVMPHARGPPVLPPMPVPALLSEIKDLKLD